MTFPNRLIQGGESGTSSYSGASSVSERYMIEAATWPDVLARRGDTLDDGTTFPAPGASYPTAPDLIVAEWRPVGDQIFLSSGERGFKVDVLYNLVGSNFNFTPVDTSDPSYNQQTVDGHGSERVVVPLMEPRKSEIVKGDLTVHTHYEFFQGGYGVYAPIQEYVATINVPKPSSAQLQAAASILQNDKVQHIHQFANSDWLMLNYRVDDQGVDASQVQVTYKWITQIDITEDVINGIISDVNGDQGTDVTKVQVPPPRKWWQRWRGYYGETSAGDPIPLFSVYSPLEVDPNGHTSLPLGSPF